jgi:hypothetical protein
MAVFSIGVSVKQAVGDQGYQTALASTTAGSTSLATLQADLTTAITNAGTNATSLGLTQVQTDLTALTGALGTGDVVVQIDTTNAGTMNKVKAALRAVVAALASGVGGVTP